MAARPKRAYGSDEMVVLENGEDNRIGLTHLLDRKSGEDQFKKIK
jgi:hypothetical protein